MFFSRLHKMSRKPIKPFGRRRGQCRTILGARYS
jgi:hypothetical protein